ncbi:putative MFS family arabinose efflux permease [Frondihabitans sp. PhB188]|uniref:MFS transporter n=1 Tax=Frondihabitans sp. PhB188 TaxID=2485200 RepID=UPI000FB6C72D|nr:MFS transporter [Frondihabitans sp. PhB188]ROQ37503.1 putative MFS family arabinose efflux permease [Frondihabitans sp. PhB188]
MTTTTRARFPWAGLLALAIASFLSISGEMLPTGLLPEMGRDLHVSESAVGLLVTVFAFTVVCTSTVLTSLTARFPRHRLLVGLILIIAIGAVGTALAPTYAWMVAARVVGGLAHGVFWAITGAYAAHLVPREQVGRALAVSSSGGTLAFVLGVPLGTALGQAVGWRIAFGILAGLMVVGAVLVWRLLPDVGSGAEDAATLRREASDAMTGATPVGPGALATGSIPIIRNGRLPREEVDPSVLGVVLTCIVTGLFMVGHYSLYTYVAPFLTRSSGLTGDSLSVALFAYGIAGAFGLLLVGLVLGKRVSLSIPLFMALVAVTVVGLLVFEGNPVASFVVFVVLGITFGALPPLLQTRLLQMAPARIRDLASSFYTSSFNLGIGSGALVGGFVLSGAGLGALPRLYIVIAVVMLAVVLLSDRLLTRRDARRKAARRAAREARRLGA